MANPPYHLKLPCSNPPFTTGFGIGVGMGVGVGVGVAVGALAMSGKYTDIGVGALLMSGKYTEYVVATGAPCADGFGLCERIVVVVFILLLICNDTTFDSPPPGAGLNTVTLAEPVAVTSDDGTRIVKRVALTNVVARPAPFQRTIELLMKLAPFTVRVKLGLPA